MTTANFSQKLLNEVLETKDFYISQLPNDDCFSVLVELTLLEKEIKVQCQLPKQFPVLSPQIHATTDQGKKFHLPLIWDYQTTELPEHQLGRLLKENLLKPIIALQTVSPDEPISYGPCGGNVAATTDQELAKQQGWLPIYSQNREYLNILLEYFARSGGILSKKLLDKCIAIFGCGSGGSYLAEQLVRSGVGKLILCDMDEVKAHNLCRSGFEIAHLGMPKVYALARKLRNINPAVELTLINQSLMKLPFPQMKELIENSDVVVAGTDMPDANEKLNNFAYKLGKPAIFPGLYQRAAGGEIVLTIPGKTPCYDCSIGLWFLLKGFPRDKQEIDNEQLNDDSQEQSHNPKLEEIEDEQLNNSSEEQSNNLEQEEQTDSSNDEVSRGTLAYAGENSVLMAEPGLAGDIQHLDSITLKLILGLLLQDVPDDELCETRDFIRGLTIETNEGKSVIKNYVFTSHSPNFWFFSAVRDDPEQDYAYHTIWQETSEFRRSKCRVCGDEPEPLKPTGFSLKTLKKTQEQKSSI